MDVVEQMLEVKGRSLWSIDASRTVYEAIEMMAVRQVGALTVLDHEKRLIGIISERDYARKVILKNKSSRQTSVAEIMTADVISVGLDTALDDCMSLMTQKKIRHLPVLAGEDPVGMITVGDLLKFIIKSQTDAIAELASYIKDETGGQG